MANEDLAARKAELDERGGAEAFPFDPALPLRGVTHARGLEKLRYVPDRRQAKSLYELHFLVLARSSSAEFQREVAREAERKRQERREWLIEMGAKALDGEFGDWLQKSARGILTDEQGNPKKDDATLDYWAQEFKRGRAMEGGSR